MNLDEITTAEIVRNRRVYSAPRRFDLATMFVVIIVYSCLLGLFVGVRLPNQATFSVLGFLTAVAIAQPALFGGKMPRLASVIVGGVALPLIFVLLNFLVMGAPLSYALMGCVCCLPLGISFGYLAGALVGGVFLIADWVRQGRGTID